MRGCAVPGAKASPALTVTRSGEAAARVREVKLSRGTSGRTGCGRLEMEAERETRRN